MRLGTLKPLKHRWNSSVVKAESDPWWRAFCSNQDAAGTRPWCQWAVSLLPALRSWYSWFELVVERLPVLLAVAATTRGIQTSPSAIPGSTTFVSEMVPVRYMVKVTLRHTYDMIFMTMTQEGICGTKTEWTALYIKSSSTWIHCLTTWNKYGK